MILTPNFGKRDSDTAHPGFLVTVPSEADIDSVLTPGFYRKYATVVGDYDKAPQAVLNGVLCSEWELNLSLTCGGATLSEVNTVLEYTGAAGSDAENIADKVNGYHVISYSGTASEGPPYPSADVSLDLLIGDVSLVRWEWTDRLWTLPIYAFLSADDGTNSGAWSIGYETSPGAFGAALGGVAFSFCGEPVTLYETGVSAASVMGSISLVPKKWLTVNRLPVP